MAGRSFILVAVLAWAPALGQHAKEGERPPRPDSASNAAVGGWCDALTGEKKNECLRDERRRQERAGKNAPPLREDERLRKGGSAEVNARPSVGPAAREH
jgi:hypothetical protein